LLAGKTSIENGGDPEQCLRCGRPSFRIFRNRGVWQFGTVMLICGTRPLTLRFILLSISP
jgi:hypothetical protein